VICGFDPLARLLVARLGIKAPALAVLALAWGAVYLFVLPAISGGLRSRSGYLGSLGDWHAQLLLLVVFPITSAFYAWQLRGIASVYEAMCLKDRLTEFGEAYRSRLWLWVCLGAAVGIVIFDSPKMIAGYGSWWMAHNWFAILGREASLALAFYMLTMMAGRQLVATLHWRRVLSGPASSGGLEATVRYQLRFVSLLPVLGLRFSVEAIELPQRAGAITPDYYLKVAAYLVVSALCFYAPIWSALRSERSAALNNAAVSLQFAGIAALPLLGYFVLAFVVGA
jgi:hypothetical protein